MEKAVLKNYPDAIVIPIPVADGGEGSVDAFLMAMEDKNGEAFVPVGGTLKDICHIDISKCKEKIKDITIVTMCDINNPLYGKSGAAFVFGPQKGATPDMVKELPLM